MPQESQVVGWPGRTLFDADGAKIGTIEDVFADERTGRPAWATVSSGLFGRKHHFVPIEQAREVHDGVAVPVAGQLVKDAPRVDQDGDLTREDERLLYRHYGLDEAEDRDDATATPTDARATDHDGTADDDGRADHEGTADDDRATGHDRATDHDGTADDDRRADPLRGDDGTRVTYAHHDERTDRDDDRREQAAGVDDAGNEHDARDDGGHRQDDDRTAAPAPAALQAEATTEARARAERERLAAEEAEHDRLTRSAPAGTTGTDAGPSDAHAHVLDRERAQEDLSVAPTPAAESHRERVPDAADVLPQRDATGDPDPVPGDRNSGATDVAAPVPDARFVGRPHVDDDHHVRHDPIIDPTGGAGEPADAGAHAGSADPARPGAGTRLRRLVRSITPAKDDHHG